jgi:hypothetical protein
MYARSSSNTVSVTVSETFFGPQSPRSCCDADIAIKSGLDAFGLAVAKPSRNITVRGNVHLAGRGISIGSEVRLGGALARSEGPAKP